MSYFTDLLTSNFPSEFSAVQQQSYVTYFLPSSLYQEESVTLLESRALISSSGSTGLRTWDAALYLGAFLASSAGRGLIHDRNVLELGAGSGFVSILCAKYLGARHVVATDGDSRVVEDMKTNLFLNDLDNAEGIDVVGLLWGQNLINLLSEELGVVYEAQIVLGADIVGLN